ncbi:ABC transporter ATP-binding protein [Opitutus terrae]|uniref:ABC transporter related n=1 Tax=Opitutus terrae (strain DSM 11246 / JCM 15787 / PB90-1) TaxID=452637 RepID=B1ZSA1_OPITP|nr:ABC transporter ATP-binding protein [Opitutus terrae]ACB75700.1 ABC transporter related [Opitutus terrae PB90-1]
MQRFRPYFHYLRPLRGQLILALFCLCIYSAASGFGLPTMLQIVFKPIFEAEARNLTVMEIAGLAMIIPAVFFLRGISGYFSSYLFQFIGTRVLEGIRLDYFRKLQVLPLAELQKHAAGDFTSRVINDAQQVQTVITALANDGIKHPLTLVAAVGFVIYAAFHSNVGIAVLCLAIVPLCVFPIRFVARKVLRRAHQAQAQIGSLSSQVTENLAAVREVRAFGLEERSTQRFHATSRELFAAQLKIVKYAQALNPIIEVISAGGIALTLIFAYESGVTLTDLTAVLLALYMCYDPVKKLGYLNTDLKRGAAALDRLEPVLHAPVAIADPATPVPITRLRGDIAFDHVTFAYNGGEPALRDASITIPAGTVCALVGPSGAGKTTFANLVPRFYEVGAGRVTVDGHDVRALRLADLRRNIAIVSQDPVLFNDTIYNNLLLGRPDATREEVVAAAVDAHADEFIRSFSDGYDSTVGERGALLSGGQKQRLALARAFLRNAPILILDEATSALDSQSEQMIQEALKKLVVGKTVLIIAHRFSTIRDATMILVFDRGEIVASGAHAELYAGNELYKSLYDQQNVGATIGNGL